MADDVNVFEDESSAQQQSDSESSEEEASTPKRKKTGAAKYRSKFKVEWTKTYPIRAVRNNECAFLCIPCNKTIRCDHQGLKDVKDHCDTATHKKLLKATKSQPSIAGLFRPPESSRDTAVIRAETVVTNFLIQHNLPLATADHLGPLFKTIFPDSDIAKWYSSGRTKTSAIVNKAMGPHCHNYIVQHCMEHPFSLGTDGSSDTDVNKMNPVTMRIFDVNTSKTVTTHFYDICVTTGRDASKAAEIFEVVKSKFEQDNIPWCNAVSLSIDNTNSMIGAHNSFASRCKVQNQEIYVCGCPCHLANIAASHAHDAFAEVLGVHVEDLLIDIYYWFDKSTKIKGVLVEYMQFCDQEYAKILKHVSTRWLSLERCVERALQKYAGLKSYFISEDFADARFQRLHVAFQNPITEIALMFNQATISLFTNFNKLLQSDEPVVHIVHDKVTALARTLGNRIIKANVMQDTDVTEIDLTDPEIFKPNKSIHLGGTTKFTLQRLLNQGDISQVQYDNVFKAAEKYFKTSLEYILKKFPMTNDVLLHAKWINVPKRLDAEWESVEFFLAKFQSFFVDMNMDALYDEFCDYQTLSDGDIGDKAWNEAKVIDGSVDDTDVFHYRVDILWWYIAHMVTPETTTSRFCYLQKVAELVTVLPHSNAGEERLFSMVRKNKTDSRSSLKLDGTLSNLLAMKLHYPESVVPCFNWRPGEALLKDSKKAAKAYNNEHKSNED